MQLNKHKLKKWIIVGCSIILTFLLLLILPFLLERLLLKPSFISYLFDTQFNSTVWFSFLGSYLGAIMTVIAVIGTLLFSSHQTSKNLKYQERLFIYELDKRELETAQNAKLEVIKRIKGLFDTCEFEQADIENITEVSVLQLKTSWVRNSNELSNCIPLIFKESDKTQSFWEIINNFMEFLDQINNTLAFEEREYFMVKKTYKEAKEQILKREGFNVGKNGSIMSLDGRDPDAVSFKEISDQKPSELSSIVSDFIVKLRVYHIENSENFYKACDNYCNYLDAQLRKQIEASYPKE